MVLTAAEHRSALLRVGGSLHHHGARILRDPVIEHRKLRCLVGGVGAAGRGRSSGVEAPRQRFSRGERCVHAEFTADGEVGRSKWADFGCPLRPLKWADFSAQVDLPTSLLAFCRLGQAKWK